MKIFSKNERKDSINALLIALMLSSNSFSILLSFISGISALVVISFFIIFLCLNGLPSNKKTSNCVLFISFVLLGFLRQIIFGNWCLTVFNSLMFFLVFGVPFLILNYYYINYKKVLFFLAILGVVFSPLNIKECLVEFMSYGTGDAQMTSSYNILLYAIPSIILCFSDNINKYINIISSVEFLACLIFLIAFGSKGAVLAMLLGTVLIFMYRKNKPIKILASKTILITVLVIIVSLNFEQILIYINDLLESYGIVSSAIPELLAKIASEDMDQISSGRNFLYDQAIDGILLNPVLGKGIGSFGNYSGDYPHNLFLHLLYEGGIFVCLPFSILLFQLLKKLNKRNQSLDSRFFFIFLISAGLIRLMFSYTYWESQLFWLSIGAVYKDINVSVFHHQVAHRQI